MKLTLNLADWRQNRLRGIRWLLRGLILIFLLVLTWQLYSYRQDRSQLQNYRGHLADLRRQLQGTSGQLQDPAAVARLQADYAFAGQLLQRDNLRWTDLLTRLEQLLPSGVSLRTVSPDYNDNSVVLDGVAQDLEQLQKLLDESYDQAQGFVDLTSQRRIQVADGRGGERSAWAFSLRLGRFLTR